MPSSKVSGEMMNRMTFEKASQIRVLAESGSDSDASVGDKEPSDPISMWLHLATKHEVNQFAESRPRGLQAWRS